MLNENINSKIKELSKHDVIIRDGLMHVELGALTYTQALEQMVITLSQVNKEQHENLVKMVVSHGSAVL